MEGYSSQTFGAAVAVVQARQQQPPHVVAAVRVCELEPVAQDGGLGGRADQNVAAVEIC